MLFEILNLPIKSFSLFERLFNTSAFDLIIELLFSLSGRFAYSPTKDFKVIPNGFAILGCSILTMPFKFETIKYIAAQPCIFLSLIPHMSLWTFGFRLQALSLLCESIFMQFACLKIIPT